MSVSDLKFERIQAAVLDHWFVNFTATPNILYPGGQLDTHDVPEWVEIHVEKVAAPGERDTVEVQLRVHCWAKFSTNQARVSELSDAATAVLEGARIHVKDFDDSAEPTVGYLRLFDAEVLDVSRDDQNRLATSLSHHIVRVRGVAQPV